MYRIHIVINDIKEYNTNNTYNIAFIFREDVKAKISCTTNNKKPITTNSKPKE